MTIGTSEYVTEIAAWRRDLEAPLLRDWISLVGRFELQPGRHRIGTNPDAEIRLPEGSAPDHVGVLEFEAGEVRLTPATGLAIAVNGVPVQSETTLRSDADTKQTPDVVTVGSVTLFIIERGPRTIVRVRDDNSPAVSAFDGRNWYPVDESYRVEGVFTPYDPPKPLTITNLLGDTSGRSSPGFVAFTLGGREHRLDAIGRRDGALLLHFRDATNGKTTYGGGRSVAISAPAGGLVTIDFNRTTNLPCAFTEYATCPLPPQANHLDIPVAAGELLPAQG